MPPLRATKLLDVLDVAAFLLDRCGPLETMKLQKLVYYAQAWHLALLHKPLFEDEEEAWAYGPVVYKLYDQHRGRLVIQRIVPVTGGGTGRRPDPMSVTCMERVVGFYGSMTSLALSRRTHEESPWREAREVGAAQSSGRQVIAKEAMQRYYAALEPPFAEF